MSWRGLFLLVGALVPAGCAGSDAPESSPVNSARPATAQPPAPLAEPQPARARLDQLEPEAPDAAPPDPAAVTRAWFAGRWSDTGNCADAGTFGADGTYRLADGTRGMWNVTDSRLVVQHAGGRAVIQLRRVDDQAVEVLNDDGSVGRSIRC